MLPAEPASCINLQDAKKPAFHRAVSFPEDPRPGPPQHSPRSAGDTEHTWFFPPALPAPPEVHLKSNTLPSGLKITSHQSLGHNIILFPLCG